ncbi:MAG: DNA alkylation repair protein [Polyangiaceae bacterium]|nr:DNA alkylation repair protein [Polyangiaceae bacterium]
MAEPLKTFFSASLVKRLAADIRKVHPAFPDKDFVKQASAGLEELELLGRGKHIAAALGAHLPPSYPKAVKVLLASLGPEHATDELVGAGMAPFYYLPHVIFVAERGLSHFDLSLRAQYELTKRFSAEFSMRAYIAHDPEITFEMLSKWSQDPNAHVRRLVSECTRLRLPWAERVAWLDANPERVLELLELLKDDPASVVRRSVANNLNDLGKVRLDLLVKTCARWAKGAPAERKALIEHALRSAVKRGEPAVLEILGYAGQALVALEAVRFDPERVTVGKSVSVSFALRSQTQKAQSLLVDLAVHFVKANGKTAPKVFKLKRVELPAKASVELKTTVSLAVHTTRKPYPGEHRVEVVVNGQRLRAGSFYVKD